MKKLVTYIDEGLQERISQYQLKVGFRTTSSTVIALIAKGLEGEV